VFFKRQTFESKWRQKETKGKGIQQKGGDCLSGRGVFETSMSERKE
jgi:hypothetical protein